jgi:predicted O-methyltransferase YrrM
MDLNYYNLYNWTNDLPMYSKVIFEDIIKQIKTKHSKILEIGTFTGTSLINILSRLPDTYKAIAVDNFELDDIGLTPDMNTKSIKNIFYENVNNANMSSRVTLIEEDSTIAMSDMIKNNIKFDFIYIDGSHKCLDVMCDIIQAWELLDVGGILGLDDVGWRPANYTDFDVPQKAVQLFADKYINRFKVLNNGYRLFVEKII